MRAEATQIEIAPGELESFGERGKNLKNRWQLIADSVKLVSCPVIYPPRRRGFLIFYPW